MFDHHKKQKQNNPSTSMSKEFQRKTERAEEIQSKKQRNARSNNSIKKYKIFIFADEPVPSLISPMNNILGIEILFVGEIRQDLHYFCPKLEGLWRAKTFRCPCRLPCNIATKAEELQM
jgi:hypothetical protein